MEHFSMKVLTKAPTMRVGCDACLMGGMRRGLSTRRAPQAGTCFWQAGHLDNFHRRAHESASTFSARSRCQQATARGTLSLSMTSRAGLSWSAGWCARLQRTPRALLPWSARCFDSMADLS
jgi:hypothetical protein